MSIPNLATAPAQTAAATGSGDACPNVGIETSPITDLFAALLGGIAAPARPSSNSTKDATTQANLPEDGSTDESPLDDGAVASDTALAMAQFSALVAQNLAKPSSPTPIDLDTKLAVDVGVHDGTETNPTTPLFVTTLDTTTMQSRIGLASTNTPANTPANVPANTPATAPSPTTTEPTAQGTVVAQLDAGQVVESPAAADLLPASLKPKGLPAVHASGVEAPLENRAAREAIGPEAATEPTNDATIANDATYEPERVDGTMIKEVGPRADVNAFDPTLDTEALAAAGAAQTSPRATPPVPSATIIDNDTAAVSATEVNSHLAARPTVASPNTNASVSEPQAPTVPLAPATQQVLEAIEPMARRADGTYHLKLSLNPHELGRVELSIELRDGVLAVHMMADRPETQRVLNEQLVKLREILDDRGISMGSLNVGDHSSRNAFGAQAQSQDRNSGSRRDPSTASSATTNNTPPDLPRIQRQSPSTNLLDVHA